MKQHKKIFAGISAMLIIVVSAAGLSVPTHPANALFGVEDITLINIDEWTRDLLESFAESLIEGTLQVESQQLINSVVSQYHIGSYLNYANNLSNQVYVTNALSQDPRIGSSQLDQYLIRSIISDVQTDPIAPVNLNPLYAKAATDAFDVTQISQQSAGASAEAFMANSGSFNASSAGQYLLFTDRAEIINANAQAAANRDINTGNGYKSSYGCQSIAYDTGTNNSETFTSGPGTGTVAGPGSTTTESEINCALQNPGSYVGNIMAGELNGLFAKNLNGPDDHVGTILATIGAALGSVATQQLTGSANSSVINSSAAAIGNGTPGTPTNPSCPAGFSCSASLPVAYTNTSGEQVLGASTSAYGTLYAVDASGTVLAGSSSSVSVPITDGAQFTVEWSAANDSGSQYAAFAPCSSTDCAGKADKLPLSGSMTGKMSGALKTFTLEVWGTDTSGQPSVIETDTIAVKAE